MQNQLYDMTDEELRDLISTLEPTCPLLPVVQQAKEELAFRAYCKRGSEELSTAAFCDFEWATEVAERAREEYARTKKNKKFRWDF